MCDSKNVVTLFTLLIFLLGASAVLAQEPNDVGVFADEAGTQSTLAVQPFVPFNIYVVAFGLDGGLRGLEYRLDGGTGLTILNAMPADGPLPQLVEGEEAWEWTVTYLACLTPDPAGPFRLYTIQLGSFYDPTGANLTEKAICIRGATPSSFPEYGGTPGWLRCDGTLVPFGVAQNGGCVYPDGCMILNPIQQPPLAGDVSSYGALKARY